MLATKNTTTQIRDISSETLSEKAAANINAKEVVREMMTRFIVFVGRRTGST